MGLKTKILLLGLILPLITLSVFALYAFMKTKQLALSGVDKATMLGTTAATDSSKTLEELGETYLKISVNNRAAYCEQALSRISDDASFLAIEAANIWNSPDLASDEIVYNQKIKPKNFQTESVVRIAPKSEKSSIEAELKLAARLNPYFRTVIKSNNIIRSVYIGTENGLNIRMPWTEKVKPGYDPRLRSWYKDAKKTGMTGWSNLYVGASEKLLMVTCYSPFYNNKNELLGVIGIDITLDSINERLLRTPYADGRGVLLSTAGKVIAKPKVSAEHMGEDDVISIDLNKKSGSLEVRSVLQDIKERKAGFRRIAIGNVDSFIAYTPIPSVDWALCFIVPVESVSAIAKNVGTQIIKAQKVTKKELIQELYNTSRGIFIALGVILVVFLVLALKISRSIIKPIMLLATEAKVIGGGDFDARIELNSGDELQQLAESFNLMAADLKSYIINLEKTTSEKERIQSELTIATDIQASMLPRIFPPFPEHTEMDIIASMNPAKEVGGDFYDFFMVAENKICLVIADVSGKGVPAALFMVISKTLLQNCVNSEPDDLASAMTSFNRQLSKDNEQLLFVTMLVVVVDLSTGEATYVNAGHNPPLYGREGDFKYIPAEPVFPVCGVMDNIEYKSGCFKLSTGDRIFLYTDGITEAFNPAFEPYGEQRLQDDLNQCKGISITDTEAYVRRSIKNYSDTAEQSDDITMLLFEYKG